MLPPILCYGPLVIRSYRYRLKPTRAQEATLMSWLTLTRELYNAALQERRDAWHKQRVVITARDQMYALVDVRKVRAEFEAIPNVIQRGAIQRLEHAFVNFFRRCKTGSVAPGYPRFRGRNRWDSLLVGDLKGRVPICGGGTRIKIPLLGKVKLNQHRQLEGTPKTMALKLESGHWYVTFACVDVPAKPLLKTGCEVGVDLGLTTFAATSDGELFENPRALASARIAVERAQRRVSRRKRGSRRRRDAVRLLARKHFHVAQVRRQHAIDVAKKLVGAYDATYVEALNIKGLARGRLAKQVYDAGWGIFLHWLRTKAECAGREVIEVNPSGTSQICGECGAEVRKDLSVRVHDCPHCGYVADRDVNAAQNIERLGRSLRGAASPVRERRRSAKLKSRNSPDRITTKGLRHGV